MHTPAQMITRTSTPAPTPTPRTRTHTHARRHEHAGTRHNKGPGRRRECSARAAAVAGLDGRCEHVTAERRLERMLRVPAPSLLPPPLPAFCTWCCGCACQTCGSKRGKKKTVCIKQRKKRGRTRKTRRKRERVRVGERETCLCHPFPDRQALQTTTVCCPESEPTLTSCCTL